MRGSAMANTMAVSRRDLMKVGGVLIVSLSLPVFSKAAEAAAGTVAESWPETMPPDAVDSYLAISADGRVTAFNGHVDLGTGVRTAIGQIVAEELDVPLEAVTVILGDTDKTPDQGPTIASNTIQVTAIPLRRAAAEARHFLVARAADQLGLPVSDLTIDSGVI